MGHLRLGTLPQTKKWQAAIALLGAGATLEEIAEAAAEASARDLGKAPEDATFQYVTQLLAELPLQARGPGFESYIRELGLAADATTSVAGLLAGIDRAVDLRELQTGRTSDIGAMAKAALLEALSERMRRRLRLSLNRLQKRCAGLSPPSRAGRSLPDLRATSSRG